MKGLMMKYFVLNPVKHDEYGQASRDAIAAYAISIEPKNKELALDLRKWLRQINIQLDGAK